MSDFIPNTFQTPNAIVDKLMFLLTDSEFRVLMYMVRHILGWQRKADTRRACISLSNFSDGFSYDTPDGAISYPGCGLGVNPIRNALKALQKYRIVEAIGKPKAIGQEWELRFMTKDDVDFVGLQLRQDKKLRSRKKQTESARKVSPKNTGVSVQQIEPQGISPTDRETISQTDSQGISPTDNNETHSKYHGKEQKDSAPVADVPKPDKAERNQWYDAVKLVWGYEAGRNINMQKFLQGQSTGSKTSKYVMYQLPPDSGLTPQKLFLWGKSYRQNELKGNPNLNMLEDLEKVQSSILAWLKSDATPKPKIVIVPDGERGFITDSASEGVIRYEKDSA